MLVLSAVAALSTADPASAATACGKKVLADWFDNGRIDRLYPLNCYEEAIDAIPDDLRDYADAEDVITRALQAALRGDLAPGGRDPTPGDDDPTAPGSGGSGTRARAERGTPTTRRPPPTSTRPARPRSRSRCSCSVECPSRCSPQAGSATSHAAAQRPAKTPRTTSTRWHRALAPRRAKHLRGYNVRLVSLCLFAGIFRPTPTVRLAPYHPLPARMTTIPHSGGKTSRA